jgi:hypothetical protein
MTTHEERVTIIETLIEAFPKEGVAPYKLSDEISRIYHFSKKVCEDYVHAISIHSNIKLINGKFHKIKV